AGYRGSAAFRTAAPWLPGEAYEDWYLIDDFAALGALNDAAIDARHGPLHDPVAAAAADGRGGLYRLLGGSPELAAQPWAAWVDKPDGARSPEFAAALEAAGPAAVWQRQLVLGPGREFCVRSASALAHVPGAGLVTAPGSLVAGA